MAARPRRRVNRVDPETMTLYTNFDEVKADVANIIPPQAAGQIALDSGLADDSGWCPVDKKTFESTLHKGIHVIGDACIATDAQIGLLGQQPRQGGCRCGDRSAQ